MAKEKSSLEIKLRKKISRIKTYRILILILVAILFLWTCIQNIESTNFLGVKIPNVNSWLLLVAIAVGIIVMLFLGKWLDINDLKQKKELINTNPEQIDAGKIKIEIQPFPYSQAYKNKF